MKIIKYLITLAVLISAFSLTDITAYASDGEYIMITIDADDDSGSMQYSLDSDNPNDFTDNNTFMVLPGTDHTIYVKDAAGNISSREFTSEDVDEEPEVSAGDVIDSRNINIDVLLDDTPDAGLDNTNNLFTEPAEPGQGTVYDRVITSTNDADAQRLFYTVTTDEGEVFYLVVDQGQSSNNVYLLDQVNLGDLNALANKNVEESEESESLLSTLSNTSSDENAPLITDTSESKDTDTGVNKLLILVIVAIAGGVYYYLKIYRNKKDEQMDLMDAMDREDFAVADDEEDDADFELDADYQEQTIARLLEEDDIYVPEDETEMDESDEWKSDEASTVMPVSEMPNEETGFPDEYATSHKELQDEPAATDEEIDEYDDDLDSPEEEEDDE